MHTTATATRLFGLFIAALAMPALCAAQPAGRLGPLVAQRASLPSGSSKVIVIAADGSTKSSVLAAIRERGGAARRELRLVQGFTAELPNAAIAELGSHPSIARIVLDRPVLATMERTGATVGATSVRQELGYDGSGVGVAIIDSGVTAWHDDLSGPGIAQRVDAFVDFVNGQQTPYDDFGHGTHVAGIVAGNGFDSSGARSGIAPGARLISLKVLDGSGAGRISDVIAALEWAVDHRDALNIRVVNLSVASGVYESYDSDLLTQAAKQAVAAGIVVVAAAGNFGHRADDVALYGGVAAPGNAPWVLTVGASSHMGTIDRGDDTMAAFSSRGPSAIDLAAKPDLVAPGVGIESLSDPASAFYTTQSQYLLPGTAPTAYLPYLAQSGTSMSAPVVAGTVALMLQANPSLTPNQVKAILEYTAQIYPGYDPLTEGAGFLNANGAVTLARFFASADGPYPSSPDWGARVIWGNRVISGGRITPGATAWAVDVIWGSDKNPAGREVSWGQICTTDICTDDTWSTWQVTCQDARCKHGPWGDLTWANGTWRNVVWGSRCGGDDCSEPWSADLFATSDGDTVVWGTNSDGDTVVWGTNQTDTVVWGTGDGDTVVWGTIDGDTVVWGTMCADSSCTPIVWK